jgi:hypothetical protein
LKRSAISRQARATSSSDLATRAFAVCWNDSNNRYVVAAPDRTSMIQRASSRPGAGDPGADEAGRRAQARARGRWIDHTAWRVSKVGSRFPTLTTRWSPRKHGCQLQPNRGACPVPGLRVVSVKAVETRFCAIRLMSTCRYLAPRSSRYSRRDRTRQMGARLRRELPLQKMRLPHTRRTSCLITR